VSVVPSSRDSVGTARYADGMKTPGPTVARRCTRPRTVMYRRRHLFIIVLIGMTGLAPIGCSSYRAPTVAVSDASLATQSEEGAVVKFTMNASHDNADVLPLREARYTLELNGRQVFTGVRSAQCTLSRFGSQQFTIPAAVPTAMLTGLSGANVPYRLSGTLTYVTPGAFAELLFDTGVSRPSVGFSQQGTLDLSSLLIHGAKVGMTATSKPSVAP